MRNKKGNVYLGISIALFIWVFGILFLPFVMDEVATTKTLLDCTNTSITGGTMLSCLAVSGVIPYLILTLVAVALGFIAGSRT